MRQGRAVVSMVAATGVLVAALAGGSASASEPFEPGGGRTWVDEDAGGSGTFGSAIAHDPTSGLTYVFGGTAGGPTSRFLAWDGSEWTAVETDVLPGPRTFAGMAYDPVRDEILLAGGSYGEAQARSDTWVYADGRWEEREPLPGGIDDLRLAYDPRSERMIGYSGYQTLAWDGESWDVLTPRSKPPGRRYASLAFDPARGSLVTFGGYSGEVLDDTWAWNGKTWKQVQTQRSPSPRSAANLVQSGQRLLLFGGTTEQGFARDTWFLGNNGWRRIKVEESPSRRTRPALAWDATRREVVLTSGLLQDYSTIVSDTWTLARVRRAQ